MKASNEANEDSSKKLNFSELNNPSNQKNLNLFKGMKISDNKESSDDQLKKDLVFFC